MSDTSLQTAMRLDQSIPKCIKSTMYKEYWSIGPYIVLQQHHHPSPRTRQIPTTTEDSISTLPTHQSISMTGQGHVNCHDDHVYSPPPQLYHTMALIHHDFQIYIQWVTHASDSWPHPNGSVRIPSSGRISACYPTESCSSYLV